MTATEPNALPRRVRAVFMIADEMAAAGMGGDGAALLAAFLDRLARPVRRTAEVTR